MAPPRDPPPAREMSRNTAPIDNCQVEGNSVHAATRASCPEAAATLLPAAREVNHLVGNIGACYLIPMQ
ncbi:hypothetical protein ON010_g6643 [Phytophthora cinnamomi]|nr:hypothetical protein ON010_g6643 [Phytophthora cinnamomi]